MTPIWMRYKNNVCVRVHVTTSVHYRCLHYLSVVDCIPAHAHVQHHGCGWHVQDHSDVHGLCFARGTLLRVPCCVNGGVGASHVHAPFPFLGHATVTFSPCCCFYGAEQRPNLDPPKLKIKILQKGQMLPVSLTRLTIHSFTTSVTLLEKNNTPLFTVQVAVAASTVHVLCTCT